MCVSVCVCVGGGCFTCSEVRSDLAVSKFKLCTAVTIDRNKGPSTWTLLSTSQVHVEAFSWRCIFPLLWLQVQKAVTTVVVKAPVADVDIECQEMFATYDEGWCKATVWQGTDLSFTATIALASVTYTFPSIAG